MRPQLLTAAALLCCAPPLLSQEAVPQAVPYVAPDPGVRGRDIKLQMKGRSPSQLSGELLAVNLDSLWVLDRGRLASVPLDWVSSAAVPRHGFSGSKAFLVGTVVGLASGLGLSAACGSVEGSDCGGVLAGSVALGAAVGGLSAISFNASSQWRFGPVVVPDSLARFARFPQGPPPGFRAAFTDSTTAP
jgi:hypothetical protein